MLLSQGTKCRGSLDAGLCCVKRRWDVGARQSFCPGLVADGNACRPMEVFTASKLELSVLLPLVWAHAGAHYIAGNVSSPKARLYQTLNV